MLAAVLLLAIGLGAVPAKATTGQEPYLVYRWIDDYENVWNEKGSDAAGR